MRVELARYYLAPIGEVMRLALPAVEREQHKQLSQQGLLEGAKLGAVGRVYQAAAAVEASELSADAEEAESKLRGQAKEILAHLRDKGTTNIADLSRQWGNARAACKKLEQASLVTE